MKLKFSTLILTFVFSVFMLFLSTNIKAQDDMDFEEFMGMLSQSFTEEQLDELSYQLPWDIKVYAYGYGDFSGDGLDDFVLAVNEKNVTPNKTLDVYFIENVGDNTYQVVNKKNYRWVEIPVEVAFMCKYGKCFVTNRDNKNWYFESFRIVEDKLVELEKDSYPIESGNAGY